jgi:hypothetical protein
LFAYIDGMSFSTSESADNLINCFPQITAILIKEGLTVNWSKTSALWASSKPIPERIKLSHSSLFCRSLNLMKNDCTEILGSYIEHDVESISDAESTRNGTLSKLSSGNSPKATFSSPTRAQFYS